MLIPFSPPPGIDSDDTTFSIQGRWADCDNVRFVEGKAQPIGGRVQLMDLSSSIGSTIFCRAICPVDRSGTTTVALGFATAASSGPGPKLRITTDFQTSTDVTPAGLSTTTSTWSLAPFGSTLLAAPQGGTLYSQTDSSAAAAVAAAPASITAMIVTPERQVLALGCNEEISTTFNARCIRGSDLEDYTTWSTTATNNAFEYILDGAGKIVGGTVFGSYVVVWTDTSLYLGTFLGDPGQTYKFDKIDSNCGLIGPKAWAILNGRLYWIGADGMPRTYAVGEVPSILPFPLQTGFVSVLGFSNTTTVGTAVKIFGTSISKFGEVRFYYPRATTECDAYIAFHPADGTWYRHAVSPNTENVITAAIDDALLIPLVAFGTPGTSLITATSANAIRAEENGLGGRPWFIKSADQYLEEGNRRIMIRGVRMDFKDQVGDVTLTLYARDNPQSTPVTKGPYTLTSGASKKDFRASGRIFSVKISGASGTYARIGKLEFDTVPMGQR